MNRNFAILGLREDATKEQVKQAYELRLRKYKSSDYDDDPDYVRKKTSELKAAYDAAYSMAGNAPAYDDYEETFGRRGDFVREDDQSADYEPDDYEPEVYKPKVYRPENYDHDKFERDRDRAARAGEDRRFKGPDISKLRDKMDNLKTTVSENVGGLVEDIRKSSEQRDRDPEERHETPAGTSANVRRLDSDQSGRIVEPTPHPVNSPRLDGSGSGRVIETSTGADKPVYNSSDSATVKGGSVAGMIIALLIGVVIMFVSMCDDGSDDYNYDDYEDTTSYSYTYNTDRDERVYNTAVEVNNLLYEQDYVNSYTSYGYSEDDVKKAADRFSKNYLEMNDVEEVTQYLYDNYGEFYTDTSASYEEQMTQILAFYGFMSEAEAEGRINPYTDKTIANFLDYLKYINKYYRENGILDGDEES